MVSLFGIFWTSGDILGICDHILQTYLRTHPFSGKVMVFHHWMTIWHLGSFDTKKRVVCTERWLTMGMFLEFPEINHNGDCNQSGTFFWKWSMDTSGSSQVVFFVGAP